MGLTSLYAWCVLDLEVKKLEDSASIPGSEFDIDQSWG